MRECCEKRTSLERCDGLEDIGVVVFVMFSRLMMDHDDRGHGHES